MEELRPAPGVTIPLGEIRWRFVASSGPGGQHVNTSNTKVEARFDVSASPSLSPEVRARLVESLGPVVRVTAQDSRSQAANREAALARLEARLAAALHRRPTRRPTRATKGSIRRRLEAKSRRSETKARRRPPPAE